MECSRRGAGPRAGISVHDAPSHSQVSPNASLYPAPPNSTILFRAVSNTIACWLRLCGKSADLLDHVSPSHSQVSL